MTEAELKSLEGLTLEDARRRVEARGLLFRVCSVDGVSRPVTADYRTNRVNVEIADGKVAAAAIG